MKYKYKMYTFTEVCFGNLGKIKLESIIMFWRFLENHTKNISLTAFKRDMVFNVVYSIVYIQAATCSSV